jgi:hypothetical protein
MFITHSLFAGKRRNCTGGKVPDKRIVHVYEISESPSHFRISALKGRQRSLLVNILQNSGIRDYLRRDKIRNIRIFRPIRLLLRRRNSLPSTLLLQEDTQIRTCSFDGGACKGSISGGTVWVGALVGIRSLLLMWLISEMSG